MTDLHYVVVSIKQHTSVNFTIPCQQKNAQSVIHAWNLAMLVKAKHPITIAPSKENTRTIRVTNTSVESFHVFCNDEYLGTIPSDRVVYVNFHTLFGGHCLSSP